MKISLIGKPLTKSLSSVVYKVISRILSCNIIFHLKETEDPNLTLNQLIADKYDGFFITIPYKRFFLNRFNEDSYVKKTYNLNCVRVETTYLYATNTDFLALKKLIEIKTIDLKNKRCLIIGNGSAAMTAAALIMEHSPLKIYISARDHSKTQFFKNIMDGFNAVPFPPSAIEADTVINATPCGMYERCVELSEIKFDSVIDFAYSPQNTDLIKTAESENKKFISGLEILVMQALVGLEHIYRVNFSYLYNKIYNSFIEEIKKENI